MEIQRRKSGNKLLPSRSASEWSLGDQTSQSWTSNCSNYRNKTSQEMDSKSPAEDSVILEEEEDFFRISAHWISLEKEKRRLRERIAAIEEEQNTMEAAFPQVPNLRGLTFSKVRMNKKLQFPSFLNVSSPPPPASSSSSSSRSPNLSSPLSSLSIVRPPIPKKRKSIEGKEEEKKKKEEKKVPSQPQAPKKSKAQKTRERIARKIQRDSKPQEPIAPMILNSQQANKGVAPEDRKS